ncbi:MAG: DUF1579 family protein [bacterium]
MDIRSFYQALQGTWEGTYHLWLNPANPPVTSKAQATVKMVANAAYCLFIYQWARGGAAHEGVFLLGGAGDKVTATWADSFHSAPEPMHCKGRLESGRQKLVFDGKYSGGAGEPDWGWRTEISLLESGQLRMEAYNISPEGQEDIAVRCEMKKN